MRNCEPSPRLVAVQVELPAPLLARIAEAAPTLCVIDKSELTETALDAAEILFTEQPDPLRIARASALRWVQTCGAGIDGLLVPELLAREELTLTNARGIHAQPVAEHVFGWLLGFVRNLHKADRKARQQSWDRAPLCAGLGTLAGKTLGIMGLGAVGSRVAQLGAAFGMHVIAYRKTWNDVPLPVQTSYGENALQAFLAASDFVVNTLPLTPATRHLLGARELEAMRPHAFLVNVGHGATIDTVALVEALQKNKLGGAALDVCDPEPLPPTHSIWKFDNVLITPHYAGAHPGYHEHVTRIFIDNLERYLAGEPLTHVVDAARGY
ncbi:MAG TPA: D-2-hydroxyacid dehydrogenase [Polyangiales bacterium]